MRLAPRRSGSYPLAVSAAHRLLASFLCAAALCSCAAGGGSRDLRGASDERFAAVAADIPLNACVFTRNSAIIPGMFASQPARGRKGYEPRSPFFSRVTIVASLNDDQDCDFYVKLSRDGDTIYSRYEADAYAPVSKIGLLSVGAKGAYFSVSDPTTTLGAEIYKGFIANPGLVEQIKAERKKR